MTTWQDIDSAPTHRGARILGWCVFPMGAEARICTNAPPYLADGDAVCWEAYGCQQNVTHWQELPPPPPNTGADK